MHVFTHVHFLRHTIPEPESINAPKFQFQNDENTVLFADMENHITITCIYIYMYICNRFNEIRRV